MASLPLDGAAHAGALGLQYRLAGENAAGGLCQQVTRHGLAVAGGGLVESTAVAQPPIGVVQEEVRSAGRTEGTGNVLALVNQVGEVPR